MQSFGRTRGDELVSTGVEALPQAAETFALPDWPRNAWYAVAYDTEVGRRLLKRTIAGRNLIFYRRRDGGPVALENACWHRLLPLSEGHLEGDEVVCGYHGLVYDHAGRCTHMPSQETINPAARVRSYPVVDRHRFVWVWTGDPALADPATIPDLHWNDDPEWAGDGRVIHALCNYKLVVDNLMDLTHETFVHGSSIGNRAVAEVPFQVTHGPNSATVTRWMLDVEPPPFWAMQLEWKHGRPFERVDRWQIINFEAPGTVAIDVGVAPAGSGAPEGDRSEGVNGYVLNTMTPETERTCHYFWSFCRNYNLDEQRITTLLREGVTGVFHEDELILAAQQQAVEANPDKQFYNLNIDGGAIWARRLIDKMVAAESDDPRYQAAAAEADAALAAAGAGSGAVNARVAGANGAAADAEQAAWAGRS
jgi:vanillate O-demethylase monooxygenase subunit